MDKAIILNNTDDALSLRNNDKLFKNTGKYHLFSTNSAVDVFLNCKYGIKCDCLIKFLTTQQIVEIIKTSEKITEQMVDCLDNNYSGKINDASGFKNIRFFRSLYGYLLYSRFCMYLALKQSMEIALKDNNIKEVLFYNQPLNNCLDTPTTVETFLKSVIRTDVKFTPVESSISSKENGRALFADGKSRHCESPVKMPQLFLLKIKAFMGQVVKKLCRIGKPTILLYDSLYDLNFLHNNLKYNILHYELGHEKIGNIPTGFKISLKKENMPDLKLKDMRNFDDNQKYYSIMNLLMDDIKEDFNEKIDDYLYYLHVLDEANKKLKIKLGVWGNSPWGFKSLVFEYLLAKNIPVLGCQHGGLLGNQHNRNLFFSDLTRCSHYITYGFNKDDLKKTYPDKNFDIPIFDFGSERINDMVNKDKDNQKQKVDIVYPIIMTISMLSDAGIAMEKSSRIADIQVKLLEYLESLKNHSVIVKPLPNANYDNLSVLPIMEKLNNIKVIYKTPFSQVLEKFEAGCIIIDFPSTSLYETLGLDTEIFVLNDSVCPIEEGALEELKKRVYYFEDVNEMISNLDLFLKGELEKKRDNTFYDHYVYKKDTKKSVLKLVDNLIKG